VKELRFYDDQQNDGNGLSDQSTSTADVMGKTAMNDECYVNKGFNDSNSLKEELSNKVWSNLTIMCYPIILFLNNIFNNYYS